MASMPASIRVGLPLIGLTKRSSGKVRDLFEVDENTLLCVATDRISAFDQILDNGIPDKGPILTQMSAHWFEFLATAYPELRTHFISVGELPDPVPSYTRAMLRYRSMLIRSLPVLPLESIVRGYLTGSAWTEYRQHGTVHGMAMPPGLRESERLPTPMWTPSTKADVGAHDENISRDRAAEIVGEEIAAKVEAASLRIYELAREYAEKRGIIIADTKFEFGYDPDAGEIVLADEVLTPDSSRFWPADKYEVGRGQESYDKQYLRDWLIESGLRGEESVEMPRNVVRETARRYREAYELLTGKSWDL